MTIILGIDPGSRITGYGLIKQSGVQTHFIDCGCITTPNGTLAERLHCIFQAIDTIASEHRPNEAAIEEVFMHCNPGSALKLGQARGTAIVAMANHQLPVAEYSARQVKQSVVGYGAAKKQQVQHMVQQLLKLDQVPAPDAADALAVALCHAQARTGLHQLLGTRRTRRGRIR